MLFIDPLFIFVFLPLAVGSFHVLRRLGRSGSFALAVLTLFSLAFYAYWRLDYLWILLGSIAFNYLAARVMTGSGRTARTRRVLLILSISANLLLLGVFKYAGFLADSVDALTGISWGVSIVLPIGISFYTFQQIAYLSDAYRSGFAYRGLVPYALFVSFFPQLIAGPIVHHREMMPQFLRPRPLRIGGVVAGITQFTIGLVKKVVIADTLATFSTPYFDVVQGNPDLSLTAPLAWMAAFAFTLQLYFDFSGYSDMALGLGRLFGIRLPVNFNSPYAARSIIDFWRRWHMTLSRFLRDYLYIPLGGNRRGPRRRYVNIMITMLLGGLWHGAGWTFVLWGGLHGIYLVVNNLFRSFSYKVTNRRWALLSQAGAWLLTFLAVIHAWVLFRADSVGAAASIVQSMWGLAGDGGLTATVSTAPLLQLGGARVSYDLQGYGQFFLYFAAPLLLMVTRRWNSNGLSVVWARNVIRGSLPSRLTWSIAMLLGFYICMVLVTYSRSEFLYFQF